MTGYQPSRLEGWGYVICATVMLSLISVAGITAENDKTRYRELPSEIKPYDLNRDGYLNSTEARNFARSLTDHLEE